MKITINQATEQKPLDIFRVGNIVVSTLDNQVIVLITDIRDVEFTGLVLKHDWSDNIGQVDSGWAKSCFEQFHGSITLEA